MHTHWTLGVRVIKTLTVRAGDQARLHADVHDPDRARPQQNLVVHALAHLLYACPGQSDAAADAQVAPAY